MVDCVVWFGMVKDGVGSDDMEIMKRGIDGKVNSDAGRAVCESAKQSESDV